MNTLQAIDISKSIQGNLVLNNINFSLCNHRIYAFQGENGSGKTMLFRVLSGLSKPTTGTILFNGNKIGGQSKSLIKIGMVIENATLYPQFTGMQNLIYLSKINNLISNDDIKLSLERVGLDPNDKRLVRKYSLGMKQRLSIAQAIMEKPDILFLDEPTNAIDKQGVELIYDIIKQEAQRGAIVLLASHVDKDIATLADVSFYMDKGEMVNG